jgi:hypothetical protein
MTKSYNRRIGLALIPDSLIKEILGETGFSSNGINSYKLIDSSLTYQFLAHKTDK